MTHPAFDVLVAAARLLEGRDGIVTAAADTTHVTDSYWGYRTMTGDTFKGGTYFQKKNGVTNWEAVSIIASSGSGTFVLANALPLAPTVGGAYTVLGNSYPFAILCQKLAQVVTEYGDTVTLDTSLLTVANQYAYTIPGASTNVVRVIGVEVEDTHDAGVYHDALGVQIDDALGQIIFPYPPQAAGLHIRLKLMTSYRLDIGLGNLPALPDTISPDWAGYEVAARVAYWRLMQPGDDTGKESQRVQMLWDQAKAMRAKRSLPVQLKRPRLAFTEVR